ncbi:MAG: glycoside hydrolase family 78 protein [Prevotellaceae bacterium]|jgi:alpha-L-rhamnosidase|nr:glycoside hydrolase family 78 protein [Prevotellaceae bacterium]
MKNTQYFNDLSKIFFLCAAFGFLLVSVTGCKPNALITDLRVEYAKNPVGIDVSRPRFSWKMEATKRGAAQTAYSITVCADKAAKTTVWNSGKVASDRSVHIAYGGDALKASTRYYWKVDVWDRNGKKLSSSEPAFFETGLMDAGWDGARWIKANPLLFSKSDDVSDRYAIDMEAGNTAGKDYRITDRDSVYLMEAPMFRTEFELSKPIRSARIYASALGIYDVFINGQRVGTPDGNGNYIYDEFKPGWTGYNKTVFYSTYDITGLLKNGKNAVGAYVFSGWWRGAIGHNRYGSRPSGFIAKLQIEYADGSTSTVVSDPATWKSAVGSPVRIGDIYSGESYDARKESDWSTPEYVASTWLPAETCSDFEGTIKAFTGPAVQVRPELQRLPVKIVKYDGVSKSNSTHGTVNVKETYDRQTAVSLKKGETLVYDLGQNMVGWIKIRLKGVAGSRVKIRFAEMLNDTGDDSRGNDGPGGSLYTRNLRSAKAMIHYTLKGDPKGETYNPSSAFFGFRYCDIVATEDVQIESLVGEVVGTAAEETASFVTDNKSVNQLYSNIQWGQRGNFLSIPTDCPQRDERLGWTGDIQVFGRTATYNASLPTFFQKWMGDMRDSQDAEGAYPDASPRLWDGGGNVAWAEAGLVIPWITYLMYGDIAILEENYESMTKYMGFLASQSDDKYTYNGARTAYGDWLAYLPTETRYISVAYYAYAAQLMEKASKALSKNKNDSYDRNAADYRTLYNNIREEFQKRYILPDGKLEQNTQTAYLLALRFGLMPDSEKENVIKTLEKMIADNGDRLNTGFVGTGSLNQTLSDVGLNNTAYNLLLQRENPSWLYSVDQGATTIWERWNSYTKDTGFGDAGMNSFNHYAYGVIGEWMFRFMAGINPDENNPGFKHIILNPTPDFRTAFPKGQERINRVNASYNSCYGTIKSTWEIDGKQVRYDITIPANTTATLVLALNGATDKVYEGNTAAGEAQGVVSFSQNDRQAVAELESGTYSFTVK